MYGGLVPIGQDDPSGELYFIFKPALDPDAPTDEIVIWLNVRFTTLYHAEQN
jgi:hypothetical protein